MGKGSFQQIEVDEDQLETSCVTCQQVQSCPNATFSFLVLFFITLGFAAATGVLQLHWSYDPVDNLQVDPSRRDEWVGPVVVCLILAGVIGAIWFLYATCGCPCDPPVWVEGTPAMCQTGRVLWFCPRKFVIPMFVIFCTATILTFSGFLYIATSDMRFGDAECKSNMTKTQCDSVPTICPCYFDEYEMRCTQRFCTRPDFLVAKTVGPVLFLAAFLVFMLLGLMLRQNRVGGTKIELEESEVTVVPNVEVALGDAGEDEA